MCALWCGSPDNHIVWLLSSLRTNLMCAVWCGGGDDHLVWFLSSLRAVIWCVKYGVTVVITTQYGFYHYWELWFYVCSTTWQWWWPAGMVFIIMGGCDLMCAVWCGSGDNQPSGGAGGWSSHVFCRSQETHWWQHHRPCLHHQVRYDHHITFRTLCLFVLVELW